MTLDDEITATENVVQAARNAAAEHLQRATEVLHLGSTAGAHYKDFLNATLLAAESTLVHCRKIVSVRGMPASECTHIVQGIMEGVRESVRAMYVAMMIVEHLIGPVGQRNAQQAAIAHTTENDTIRTCSFCGKTEAQSKLAAGPAANICATCTRLACGVLGIGLSGSE
jgi:hypothetical protein